MSEICKFHGRYDIGVDRVGILFIIRELHYYCYSRRTFYRVSMFIVYVFRVLNGNLNKAIIKRSKNNTLIDQ